MTDDPRHITVLSFDSRLAADEALTAALRLQSEGKILIEDAVFVTKGQDGKAHVRETTDPSIGQSALGGAFWGLLFGILFMVPFAGLAIGAGSAALVAKIRDTGVNDDFIKTVKQNIEAGKTNLILLATRGNEEAVRAELQRFAGLATVAYSTLPEETITEVKEALKQEA